MGVQLIRVFTIIAFSGKIERVSDIIFTLAQFIYILWPLFIITALVYSFQGHLAWRALGRRIRQSLFVTWIVLLIDWVITLFAPLPTPGLIPEPTNTLLFFAGFALLLLVEASRLGLLRRRLQGRIHIRRTRSLKELMNMDPYAFENLVAETYRALGCQARHVGHSGDHGVDIELTSPQGERWIVQCKRYHGTVGESIIRDLYGTMVSEKARRAILVTTAHITPPAEAWAQGKPIELVDGPALLKLMDEAHRRTQGTLLSRLAAWLEGWLAPPAPTGPAGLRPQDEPEAFLGTTQPVKRAVNSAQPVSPLADPTQPVRIRLANNTAGQANHVPMAIHPANNNHHVAPVCPVHGLTMVPMPARASDRPGRVLYRCRNYPSCRVVLEPEKVK